VVALGATIRVGCRGGTRDIAPTTFFRGIYTTALGPGEIVTEILVPRPAAGWRWSFDELARRHGDFALAGVAAGARVESGVVAETRLVFFGVGTRPVRARRAEAALAGRRATRRRSPRPAGRSTAISTRPETCTARRPCARHLARVLLARVVGRLAEAAREDRADRQRHRDHARGGRPPEPGGLSPV